MIVFLKSAILSPHLSLSVTVIGGELWTKCGAGHGVAIIILHFILFQFCVFSKMGSTRIILRGYISAKS